MIGNFMRCCGFSFAQEGGYCNVKGDPGGATSHGITIGELSGVLGRPATVQDVMALTPGQAQSIYQRHYWQPVNGDNLPAGVDVMVFDFGITAGPETSARRLQALLGMGEVDGKIGPATIGAMAGHLPRMLVAELAYSHETYYRGLAGFAEFGKGWLARNARAQAFANSMIGSAIS